MGWSLFSKECGACGTRTRDAVPPPGITFAGNSVVCKVCFARLKSESDRQAEEDRRTAEQARGDRWDLSRKMARAAEEGNAAEVMALISKGANVNERFSGTVRSEETVLIMTTQGSSYEIPYDQRESVYCEVMRVLIDNGADLNARDSAGMTALMWASKLDNRERLSLLISRGADINLKSPTGETALTEAYSTGNFDVAQILLANGAEGDINCKDNSGNTPLMEAARKENLENAAALVSKGADVNATNNEGVTPLYYAAEKGNLALVQMLLSNGADVNLHAKGKNGEAALNAVSRFTRGHTEIALALLDAGADVNTRNSDGSTPLIQASFSGNIKMVEVLIKRGADIQARNKRGNTALDEVPRQGHNELEAQLRAAGARADTHTAREQKSEPKLQLDMEGLQETARECISLLAAANEWGERRGFEDGWMKKSPHYKQIRKIGESVNSSSGLDGMAAVIQMVRRSHRHGYLLDHFWDGIGQWFA